MRSEPTADAFQLSLRIRHPSMDPAEISSALNLRPEHSFRAGGPCSSSTAAATGAVHRESYWLGVLNPLAHFSELLLPADRRIRSEGGEVALLVTIDLRVGMTKDEVRAWGVANHLVFSAQHLKGQMDLATFAEDIHDRSHVWLSGCIGWHIEVFVFFDDSDRMTRDSVRAFNICV
ncbi:MAG TPA: hypothetical protein VMD49_06420 [Steroidobacteraceae bacterium]|nr:hypothetical protein [Steroidobacteraceae bacterium]